MSTPQRDNLEAFDYAVALVFSELFERFPERVPIRGSLLMITTALDKNISDEVRQAIPQILSDTVRWLREEGFVRYESEEPVGEFRNATLTLRGLTVLGYVPVSLKVSPKHEPLIEKLRSALKSGATTALHEVIKEVVGQSFKFLLGAATIGVSDV